MPNYSIWGIPESDLTISGGETLSNPIQGEGLHLLGLTITINSRSWEEIEVRDGGDSTFDDNDNNQVLNGAQTVFGVSYPNNARIEAEYLLTLEAPDGTEYQVIGLNINEPGGSPAFATVEGLVFVGDLPPTGVPLTVVATSEGPGDFGVPPIDESGVFTPPCFTAGTLIRTAAGRRPVETLRPGDAVWTADSGEVPLRLVLRTAIGARRLARDPWLRPVTIRAHALGPGRPARDLTVSPQHRVLVDDWRAALYFGAESVLVPAKALIDGRRVATAQTAQADYVHLVFDDHQIVETEGVLSESFLPGPVTLPGLSLEARRELVALFPQIAAAGFGAGASARPAARAHEALALA